MARPRPAAASLLQAPPEFQQLESALDRNRALGLYREAWNAQSDLAVCKRQEERKQLQAMADRHRAAIDELAHDHELERAHTMELWHNKLADLAHSAGQQEDEMLRRHACELQAFQEEAEASMPKPKWSSSLLNTRRVEEHLVRQHELARAAMVKAGADERQAEESVIKENEYWMKVACERVKLLQCQAKELEALRMRCATARDETSTARERDLERLSKRSQVQRAELCKAQALERLDMETARKGWYNLSKAGLGPSPLVPSSPLCVSLMTPTAKLTLHRDLSPTRRTRSCSLPSLSAPQSPCSSRLRPSALASPSSPGTTTAPSDQPETPVALRPKARGPGTTPIIITAPNSPRVRNLDKCASTATSMAL